MVRERLVGWGAVALLAATVSVTWRAWSADQVLVVFGIVITQFRVAMALTAGAAVLGLTRAVLWAAAQPARLPPAGTRRRQFWFRIGRYLSGFLISLLALAALMGVAFTLIMANNHHFLGPRSPAGCRVDVVQSFSGGRIYLLPPDSLVAFHAGDYWTDDGYEPVTQDTIALSWRGEVATLQIWGGADSPVGPRSQELDCSASAHS